MSRGGTGRGGIERCGSVEELRYDRKNNYMYVDDQKSR